MVKPSLQLGLPALTKIREQAGVTLIEMIVVVAIIAMVSSVIIFNYSDFSSNVSLRNLTQEVALSVRKAQTYATSVRPLEGITSGMTSRAFPGYGISFSLDNQIDQGDSLPDPKQFALFADVVDGAGDTDGVYHQTTTDCGSIEADNECLEVFGITTADKIVGICADGSAGTGPYDSGNSPIGCEHGSVDITFDRPNPDAHIMYHNAAGVSDTASYAKIILESAKGLYRSVTIWNTGQISVQ